MGGFELAGRIVTQRGVEEEAAFQERFMRLIERRTALYTMGESTSVPTHVAVELLRSVSFVLGIDPENPEIPERLLTVDLEDEFRRNLTRIEQQVELSGELWREVVAMMPPIPSTALRDTLAAIGEFPRQYDFRSMAHEIPVTFDYPPCLPVPEALQGVEYINEYLRHLLCEADFLRHFDAGACVRVLEKASPDFEDLLVNLYEPVAANALGRLLLGKDPRPLRIDDEGRASIAGRLGPLSSPQRVRLMREVASSACGHLGVQDETARYLQAFVSELMVRIEVGLAHGDLRGVFAG